MITRAKIHEFYKKVKIKFYLLSRILKFCDLLGGGWKWQQMENLLRISPKLCQLS